MTDTAGLIERAKAMVAAMSPEERSAHFAEQRANWVKAESELSRLEAETTVVGTVRHPFTTDEIHAAKVEFAKYDVLLRLYNWIMAGASDAQTAFTASELRNVAREVEYRIHAAREEGRRAGMMEAAQIVRGLQHPAPLNTVQGAFVGMARFATERAADAIEAKAKE